MPIRITCQHCGKAFSAWDDLVGKKVQCPKCKSHMTVPTGGLPTDGSDPLSAPVSSPPREKASTPRPGQFAVPKPVKVTPGPRPEPAPLETPGPSLPVRPPPVAPHKAAGLKEQMTPCPKCKVPMPLKEDLCDACGYHKVLQKVLDLDGVERPDETTGIERFIKGQLRDEETTETAIFWAKIVAGLLFVWVIALCFGPLGMLLSTLCVVAYIVYSRMTRHRRDATDSAVNRDLFGVLIWSGILLLQRAVGWRQLAWPFPKTRVLTMHTPSFDDDELSELQLSDLDTLDFEGTQVSDAGLVYLKSLKHLSFVVLRRTNVTSEGVVKLQRALRKTWIWH